VSALIARRLTKTVRPPSGQPLELLRGVDLEVAAGESIAIVGRSGSGKSTLLSVLGMLAAADTGSLLVGGRDVSQLSDRKRAELRTEHVGFVFQNYSLLAHLSAAENVELPLRQGPWLTRAEIRRRRADVLDAVGLNDRAHSRPRQLSGGEQQRVALARAIVRRPSIILADEPTGALDAVTAELVFGMLVATCAERGTALIVVTHDSAVAARLDRTVYLREGRLVSDAAVAAAG
jgi:ABC-type lipoprotein export system ATPase subunit